jgi:heterodisulfide reductase subunit B
MLREQKDLRDQVNSVLKQESLEWRGGMDIKHLLSVLSEDVGIENIKEKVRFPYDGLQVAAHYGCHALRPSNITHFDDPLQPTIFEKLIEATGAKSLDWDRKLECCGQPVWGKNDNLSIDLMRKKIEAAQKAGAHCLCTACTYCQLQFDVIQESAFSEEQVGETSPALLYTQLLGLAMGLDEKTLGLEDNHLDPVSVKEFIGPETETQEQPTTNQ